MNVFGKRNELQMTEGPIWKLLMRFSIPLLIGNLFQQFYNTVDSVVVGRFVGKEALAAVGSTANIINVLIGCSSGLAVGASVVVAQYFGARDKKGVEDAVHTIMLCTFGLCLVFTGIGILMVDPMLRLMATPADVYEGARTYLRIYFSGISFTMIYDMGAGILRAVGDSRRPLYFLIASSMLNVVLDLHFVLNYGWGIAGAAWATVISQAVSTVLIVISLSKTDEVYRLRWKRLKIVWPILKKVVLVGLPTAFRMMITSFSNVFVMSYINFFGSAVMAGWTVYVKVDQFMFLPMQSLSLSVTTFVGQNLGANNWKRAKEGIGVTTKMSVYATLALMVAVEIFAEPVVGLFTSDPEVLRYGVLFCRIISPFYCVCCVNQVLSGALCGAGDSMTPMVYMLSTFVVFRQIYLFVISRVCNAVIPVVMGYPAAWVLCSLLMLWYFRTGRWEKRARNIAAE